MVDFGKRLAKKCAKKLTDPLEIYETLDRASDKGPLRPAQFDILKEWHEKRRTERDIIVKLHTGQGKTLIGLLILQAHLNDNGNPAVYLCANNYLVAQTCQQAQQFGIRYCEAEGDLPSDFIDGQALLITTIHKMFNGLTRFRMGPKSISVGSILMDDSHACIDAIRDAVTIKLSCEDEPYKKIVDLFSSTLEAQGAGTYADLRGGDRDALLPVPYWEWMDRQAEVVSILSKGKELDAVKFAWPILKDLTRECRCVISGGGLEISPCLPPLDRFGSYWNAQHRIFMSATVTDDAFLVKGLRLSPAVIRNPLVHKKEKWSGEKMILIPSLIDGRLDRSAIVNRLGKATPGRKHGVVVLAPSFRNVEDWKACGATVATKDTIDDEIARLRNKRCEVPLVIVNRYDGIDLPDDVCRILVFDSKPYSEALTDRYEESCRAASRLPPRAVVSNGTQHPPGRTLAASYQYDNARRMGTTPRKRADRIPPARPHFRAISLRSENHLVSDTASVQLWPPLATTADSGGVFGPHAHPFASLIVAVSLLISG